jgi:type IV secretory pathway protease TraF
MCDALIAIVLILLHSSTTTSQPSLTQTHNHCYCCQHCYNVFLTDVQGDVMLIQKVTRSAGLHTNDIVFFTPPTALQEAVAAAGGSLRSSDLFVKRIAALPGNSVTVTPTGNGFVFEHIQSLVRPLVDCVIRQLD